METKTIFRRKLYTQMVEWKQKKNGSTALMIEGARRVGKSTLVRLFAEKEYKTHIFIDFTVAKKEVFTLFEDMSDMNLFFAKLKMAYGVELFERKSLIVFDEVQLQPFARQAIKHLVADGRYDYIETGSLISIKKNVQNILIPSEESKLLLQPMDFEEFRWAMGDETSVQVLRDLYTPSFKMGDMHREMMRRLRLYMVIGGMPQAVDTYLKTQDFRAVDDVKRSILDLYADDFAKIDISGRLSKIFNSIPAQLSQKSPDFKPYSVISRGVSKNAIEEALAELENSRTIIVAHHTDDPNIGLALTTNFNKYKLYLADTGLFVTLAFKDKDFTENVIYQKLLSDKLSANLGNVYENLVAQMLRATGKELYYHTFHQSDDAKLYEVDFLFSHKDKLCPIEVKSAKYRAHTSIDLFCEKYSTRVGERYLIHTKDFDKEGSLRIMPTYATCLL